MTGAIRNKEGWTAWVRQPVATNLTVADRAAYKRMTTEERAEADEIRRTHNARPVIIRTQAMADVYQELSTTLRLNRHAPPGARGGLVLDGPPTVGKTTQLLINGRRYERELRHREPELFSDPTIDHQPVVYLTLPAAASPKALARAFCEYLNIPTRARDTQADLTRRVLDVLDRCGTELIMVDDLHFLDLSQKDGRYTNDYLKELANSCAATFVYAGVDLGKSTLFNEGAGQVRDTQTSSRFTVFGIKPFAISSKDGQRQWMQAVKAMEDHLVLYKHEPESLTRQHWRYLHERTRGSISSLSYLIRRAADRAVDDGDEAITKTLLAKLTSDLTAQRHYTKQRKDISPAKRASA